MSRRIEESTRCSKSRYGPEVQWFQARRDNQIKQPLPAQADGVEGQAERAAGLQLHRPDRECLADQPSGGAVPLSADSATSVRLP